MVIMQSSLDKQTEFIVPVKACRRCGDRLRYKSDGKCVRCKRDHDAMRTDDRRSVRRKADDTLRARGHKMDSMTRREKDYLIATNFPLTQEYFRDVLKVAWWMP